MLSGTSRQTHSEACRSRMTNAIQMLPSGQLRISRQEERENMKIARKIAEDDRKDE